MPKYKVLEKSFINNSIVEPGEIVELDAKIKPKRNLELIEEKKPAQKKAEKPSKEPVEAPLAE